MCLPQNLCAMCHNMTIVILNPVIYKWPSYWSFAIQHMCLIACMKIGAMLAGAFLSISVPISRLMSQCIIRSLQWRHKEHDGVSNHQPYDSLLNRLFRCRWNKPTKLRVTGLCEGNSPVTGEFPHKGPVTRKMFPLDYVIMHYRGFFLTWFDFLYIDYPPPSSYVLHHIKGTCQ